MNVVVDLANAFEEIQFVVIWQWCVADPLRTLAAMLPDVANGCADLHGVSGAAYQGLRPRQKDTCVGEQPCCQGDSQRRFEQTEQGNVEINLESSLTSAGKEGKSKMDVSNGYLRKSCCSYVLMMDKECQVAWSFLALTWERVCDVCARRRRAAEKHASRDSILRRSSRCRKQQMRRTTQNIYCTGP